MVDLPGDGKGDQADRAPPGAELTRDQPKPSREIAAAIEHLGEDRAVATISTLVIDDQHGQTPTLRKLERVIASVGDVTETPILS